MVRIDPTTSFLSIVDVFVKRKTDLAWNVLGRLALACYRTRFFLGNPLPRAKNEVPWKV